MNRLMVKWGEDGKDFIDILEIGKDCTQEQANKMIEDGHAKIMEDEK